MTTDEALLALRRQQVDMSLHALLGVTWDEIAAQHDMRCGACRVGTLTLQEVNLTRTLWPPQEAITITLTCDTCGVMYDMPYQAREETSQP